MKDTMFNEFKKSYLDYLNSTAEEDFYKTLDDAMSFSFSEVAEETKSQEENTKVNEFINIDDFLALYRLLEIEVILKMKSPSDKNIVVQTDDADKNIELKEKESHTNGSLFLC